MSSQTTPAAGSGIQAIATHAEPIEVVELEGQAAEDLLVSDFGALSLEPTTEADFFGKLQRAFGRSNGSAA